MGSVDSEELWNAFVLSTVYSVDAKLTWQQIDCGCVCLSFQMVTLIYKQVLETKQSHVTEQQVGQVFDKILQVSWHPSD